MARAALGRMIIVVALACAVPAAAVAQDEGGEPDRLGGLALRFEGAENQIERLHERIDDLRVGTLRDRIKALEAALPALQARRSSPKPSGSAFDAAEKVLVKGIPGAVRSTCRPLRGSSLPSGTVAAVQCRPKQRVVDSMAYYLMEYPAAERTFTSVMDRNGVPGPGRRDCSFGRPTQMLLSPYNATGCFVAGDRANVRVVTWAHKYCRQLDVADDRLREPVVYVALEGAGSRIRPLWRFALKPDENATVDIWRHIPQSGTPRAEGCRSVRA